LTGPLTELQHLLLRCSAAGGGLPMRPKGPGQWRAARILVDKGLGAIEGRTFIASPAGVAVASQVGSGDQPHDAA